MTTDAVIPIRPSYWKWGITGLLLLATTINYMDRVALASASVRVTTELGLTDVQYGNLELAFGWAFAAGSLAFGFLADRFSVYWLYPAVLASWSLMGMATGWSNGFTELLICRALLGFFEAGHWPCALKTTFALLNEKERTMGNSILQSGASIGAIITPQIMKLLITDEAGSWRSTFIAVGATGFVWVIAWFMSLRSTDFKQTASTTADANAPTLMAILRSGRLWAVAILVIGMQIVWHTYRVWLMKFLQIGRGYEERVALDFNSLYFLATDVGCIFAGVASLWLVRRYGSTPHNARRTVFAFSCLLTSTSMFLPWLDKGWPLLFTLLLIGAGALAMAPCYYSFVQELSVSHVGRLTGLLGLWVWAVTSPMHSLFGMLADVSKSYDMVLVVAGIAPWIGVLSMKFLWNRDSVDTIQVSA